MNFKFESVFASSSIFFSQRGRLGQLHVGGLELVAHRLPRLGARPGGVHDALRLRVRRLVRDAEVVEEEVEGRFFKRCLKKLEAFWKRFAGGGT